MKRAIVSGYFNPLHGDHLELFEDAALSSDYVIVIVNNDQQQIAKKGKIILPESNRARLIQALRVVDEVIVAVDQDESVAETLHLLRAKYPADELIFCNGGDRVSGNRLPVKESRVCSEQHISMRFGMGSAKINDSSTRINRALGYEN